MGFADKLAKFGKKVGEFTSQTISVMQLDREKENELRLSKMAYLSNLSKEDLVKLYKSYVG